MFTMDSSMEIKNLDLVEVKDSYKLPKKVIKTTISKSMTSTSRLEDRQFKLVISSLVHFMLMLTVKLMLRIKRLVSEPI